MNDEAAGNYSYPDEKKISVLQKEQTGITGDKAADRLDSRGELIFDRMTGNR